MEFDLPVWLSGNTLVSISIVTLSINQSIRKIFNVSRITNVIARSTVLPGSVSAWMGDRLWRGKPFWRRIRHPRLISLSHPSVGRCNEYPVRAGAVNRHIT